MSSTPRIARARFFAAPLALFAALSLDGGTAAGFPDLGTCPATSTPTTWTGSSLDTNTTKNGTVYDGTGARLRLSQTGATFNATQLGSAGTVMYAAVGDFNNDGWPDFIGASENTSKDYLAVFRNWTWQNENCTTPACTAYSGPPPNWSDPTHVVTPKFTQGIDLHSKYISTTTALSYSGRYSLAAADFNGDGWDDLFEAYAPAGSSHAITTFHMYLNNAANDASGNPQFRARYNAASFTPNNVLGQQLWSTGNVVTVDYNKDGRMDVLVGNGAAGGSIRILLNSCTGTTQPNGVVKCTSNPMFTDGGYLISNLNANNSGFGTNTSGGTPAFAYADVDGDGLRDLVVGAPNCCTQAAARMRIFKGCTGGTTCAAGLEKTASQSVSFVGAATNVFLADFSLDGKLDLIVATDNWNYNSGNGGATYYYENNGTTTPFSGAPRQLTAHTNQIQDYDIGFVFDYDRDPTHSPDLMIADGNDAAKYYVLADRVSPQYVPCGDAASGVIDLGAMLDDEMVVTAARITPTFQLNGGSITFWLSNEEPPNWVQASLCPSSTTDYCVSFPKPVGRSVRWKAVMCSNAQQTTSPTLSGMNAKFDYTRAREHYRAGVVMHDGLAYLGAFHQPGERGRFYAVNADLTTTCNVNESSPVCWDGAAKLDARPDGQRKIYTAVSNLAARLEVSSANAGDPLLQNLLRTADQPATQQLVSWIRSPRFGVGNPSIPMTKLGSVETSTPAVLSKPGRPNWYSFVTAVDRARIEAFISANANRKPLVLFGSKDGMIHALHSRAAELSSPRNGEEAWAFVPPTVASRMLNDYTATTAANVAAGNGANHPKVSAYPDGSPTLVDFHLGGGVFKTAALVAEGNGGRSFTVLDVTSTVDPLTDAITGPLPMWSATPGDGEAGQAYAKPVVARVLIDNQERYLAIAGTGVDYTDTLDEKGRVVAAYDLATGQPLWTFQAKCPVTSDLSVFETDDLGEPGAPTLNGFADRVVFADKCGFVYKVDPAIDLEGGWLQNTGMGSILANTTPDGKAQYALFSTRTTPGALGEQRPITGTLAARTDSSTRMVLFFGTGGLENVAATRVNAFYAVYADTGEIRSKFVGSCNAAGACEKFYGGTVVTPEQVIFTRTIDPAIGTNACELGSSTVQAVQLNDDVNNQFVTDFTLAVSSAVMGSLYGDAGAIYFATLSGDIARIGTPRAGTGGGDTHAGTPQGMGTGDQAGAGETVGTTSPFVMMGWRVVL
ncbi:MAG: hypothetical protein ACTHU0_23060 [Kofleriaceae bacterium]